ncbi:bifunctional 4-hydroxy-2-oxoglutarate aldolase/2-dehydro-3-deoxy-phosphogluconate aldolase [Pelagibacterium sediminicola]|uniref:bifunctional 4-hydroxy-2-oxoglutarate aldolase/2-dehydro-3-deoxy-phosphogluconate aldolase n=1 Tax=Pelagibacterium sediminicola TaxID=2248761 RepID=UPI000E30B7DE|nr:bifunctional 4-hydroxy-2-oxoglutarate aldolase/2-dehydro-3-deoxy-phosphogluconate aldolase [Pelagibacterium sediminicola]
MSIVKECGARMLDICTAAPVIPVLVVEDVRHARPLAAALVRGGLPVLEVTLRTPAALDIIATMSDEPGAIVGAGTLLDPEDVDAVIGAGAQFGVSPGSTDELLDTCEARRLPFLPGVSTVSEVMRLRARGYDLMKFFPAEASGGVAMLKGIAGPIPNVRFCPTGGVGPDNLAQYRGLSNVVCVGGSWITPVDAVQAEDWQAIEDAARAVSE